MSRSPCKVVEGMWTRVVVQGMVVVEGTLVHVVVVQAMPAHGLLSESVIEISATAFTPPTWESPPWMCDASVIATMCYCKVLLQGSNVMKILFRWWLVRFVGAMKLQVIVSSSTICAIVHSIVRVRPFVGIEPDYLFSREFNSVWELL